MKPLIEHKKAYFDELFQANSIKFAFVKETKKNFIQQHSPVLCRDFLNDVLLAEHLNSTVTYYKFTWNPEVDRIDRDSTKIYMSFPKKEQLNKLKENISFLNDVEFINGFKRSIILDIDDFSCIIIGSNKWTTYTWCISLYTYILKALSLNKPENWELLLTGQEKKLYDLTKDVLFKFLKNLRKAISIEQNFVGFNLEYNNSLDRHNYSGFVAALTPGHFTNTNYELFRSNNCFV